MNRRKKALGILFTILFLFCCVFINVSIIPGYIIPACATEHGNTDGGNGQTPATPSDKSKQSSSSSSSPSALSSKSHTLSSSQAPSKPKPIYKASSNTSSKAPSAYSSQNYYREPTSSRIHYTATYSSSPSSSSAAASEGSSSSKSPSSTVSMPNAEDVSEVDPLASAVNNSSAAQMNHIGILAWVCIGLGILVILIVIFSNNHNSGGGPGHKRYHRPKRSKKKRLLNEKYYRGLNRY